MKPRAIWTFIAGDSKFAPLGVALAVGLVLLLERLVPAAGMLTGVAFVTVIAAGLVAGVFERV